jgi:hypothetical protein
MTGQADSGPITYGTGPARLRAMPRRRRTAIMLLVATAGALIGIDLARDGGEVGRIASTDPALAVVVPQPAVPQPVVPQPLAPQPLTPQPSAAGPAAARATADSGFPAEGPHTFGYAAGPGPVLGTAGTLRRFLVAVEDGMGQAPGEFAAAVDAVLGDGRSWIAGGGLRLQRVPQGTDAEFTVYLATPGTSTKMCAEAGVDTDGYTSCRTWGRVIINVARWMEAVPGYGAPLAGYRAYAINHEVGHQLGYGHEACPAAGRPAPVMQQQTLGLAGCLPNGWPFPDGRRYSGPAVP